MPNTPVLALPYPALVGVAPDVPYWNKLLAEAVEAAIAPTRVWQAYAPVLAGTGWTLGNGTLTGRYCQIGKTVHFASRLVIGSTTAKGSGQLNIGLPVTATAMQFGLVSMVHDISPNTWFPGQAVITSGAALASFFQSSGAAVHGTAPVTLATGDEVFVNGTYEAA